MLSNEDKNRLRKLRDEGYLSNTNPLTAEVLVTVVYAADETPRPEWLDVFLTMEAGSAEDHETEPLTAEEWLVNAQTDADSVFALMGRSEPEKIRKLRSTAVIRQWIRQGLSASPSAVAKACDVSQPRATQVRNEWGDEIRALLQEAACLGLNGEDLYLACNPALPPPTRLIERLRELREARGSKGGMLRQEFDTWLRQQWFEYRQRNPSKWDTDYPPRWFIEQLA